VQIQGLAKSAGFVLLNERVSDQAAKAACQISGILILSPPSLPVLNWPFLIFSASSIPLDHNRCVSEAFQAQHRTKPLLHTPVILFDDVIQIFTAPHPDSLGQLAALLQISHGTV